MCLVLIFTTVAVIYGDATGNAAENSLLSQSDLELGEKLQLQVTSRAASAPPTARDELGEGLSVSDAAESPSLSILTATGPTYIVAEGKSILCEGWKRRGYCNKALVKTSCATWCNKQAVDKAGGKKANLKVKTKADLPCSLTLYVKKPKDD